jgi:hypothetical protein
MFVANKRLIFVDKQGITGRKAECKSVGYRSRYGSSIETAGTFDLDAELKIWVSNETAPSISNLSIKMYYTSELATDQ